jgi:hypothetical protein
MTAPEAFNSASQAQFLEKYATRSNRVKGVRVAAADASGCGNDHPCLSKRAFKDKILSTQPRRSQGIL